MPQTELRKKLKEKYGNESVLVIPSEDLQPIHLPEGFIKTSPELYSCIDECSGFMFRYLVEYNIDFRQPIPYILIRNYNSYFATRRLEGSGESRLHGKISLGVGGHINPEDFSNNSNTVVNALKRELDEELVIGKDAKWYRHLEGFINDNSNEVSRDHIAVVYTVNVDSDDVTVRETDKLEGRFYSIDELKENYDNLESWSQLIFDHLINAAQ
jgi:predicted NUDIX family phosphoesterase